MQELEREHEGRIRAIETTCADQIYAAVRVEDIPSAACALRTRHGARIVTVFAEDRVAAEGAFYNYYVFERPGDPCYLILKARIPADEPRFPSLASDVPSVNWQEREIQDWFGIEAVGHPESAPRGAAR